MIPRMQPMNLNDQFQAFNLNHYQTIPSTDHEGKSIFSGPLSFNENES